MIGGRDHAIFRLAETGLGTRTAHAQGTSDTSCALACEKSRRISTPPQMKRPQVSSPVKTCLGPGPFLEQPMQIMSGKRPV